MRFIMTEYVIYGLDIEAKVVEAADVFEATGIACELFNNGWDGVCTKDQYFSENA